jgi:hypothetical protein
MRTFNGLQIFTAQLTQSGQLDTRYVRISGDAYENKNLYTSYSLYKNQNFTVDSSLTVFTSDNSTKYTGYLPDIIDTQTLTIKNISSSATPLFLTGYNGQKFDNADSTLNLSAPVALKIVGIKNNSYTGWLSVTATAGIS